MNKPKVRNDTKPDKFKVLKNKDIKHLRAKLLEQQKGLDPITGELITIGNLDHSHFTGFCRQTLQDTTNLYLGKIENGWRRYIKHKGLDITLPQLLRNFADYLEKDYSEVLHPKSIGDLVRKFNRMKYEDQEVFLLELGLDVSGTKAQKAKVYRKYLMRDENILKF